MNCSEVINGLRYILTEAELDKVRVKSKDKEEYLFVDLHGLTTKEAERFTNNIVNIARGEGVIAFCHGFNHGTAIKELLVNKKYSSRVVCKESPSYNPGLTYFKISAA